ncbi:tagatose 6-phosphate kinase [Motilibacter peucedani]|uniref:Tagatose 6-phosphate kinase n=1 Tax=Motilibacter peucedani TaxID=598650 RepID=A0A420XQK8_9ACTN|nr:hexose kinase [Motilibacter peucedani]RKS75492.1 tagatose 6-phosphate kinase [Motilibacter peucedani]
MILTVTLNPAWDLTWSVDSLAVGGTNRVQQSSGRAGGKGVNVSRVLRQMGAPTVATGVVGGAPGQRLLEDLDSSGTPHRMLVDDSVETRSTLAVRETDGRVTILNEPGPVGPAELWARWLSHLDALLHEVALVVCSGSLPPWAPEDAYAVVTRRAHAARLRCIVDADGAALRAALPAGPDLVKPNEEELLRATGGPDVRAAGATALSQGAQRVVVSRGPQGLLAVDSTGTWEARPPALQPVNPTGAGDAAVAALAVGLVAEEPWPDVLRRAVAWSAAAVLHPAAGTVEASAVERLTAATEVRQVG